MQTIYFTSDQVTPIPPQSVITIGNFDGIHLGHQSILRTTKKIAKKNKATAVALTLEPHPRCVFNPTQLCTRLTSLTKKSQLMSQLGIDFLLVLPFSKEFAKTSAQDFVEHLLYQHLKISHVIIGKNFVFGKERQGTPETLQKLGKKFAFDVTIHSPVITETGQAYSSTRIRECLRQGQIKEANYLLGYPWEIEGKIIVNNFSGTNSGFTTTTIALDDFLIPALGVYAGYVRVPGNLCSLPAMANISIKGEKPYCEIHLFDHKVDIQGQCLSFQFTEFLRNEKQFDSIDALKVQMATDCQRARHLLAA